MTALQADRILECEGLACPMPVVRTKKTIDEMKAGEVLEVRATDKGSVADLSGWAGRTGHHYVGMKEEAGVYRHFIRKAEASETKADMGYPHTVTNEQLQAELASGGSATIIDVREPAEYAFGRIPGAVSIPLGEIETHIAQLDPDKQYFIVCRSGNRSDTACRMLSAKGFGHIRNVVPGMSQWTYEVEVD